MTVPAAAEALTRPADPHARSTAETQAAANDVLEVRPGHPFFYVHYKDHPGNWFVGEIEAGEGVPEEDVGHWWLPKLQKEIGQPGVNGHRTLPRGARPEEAYDQAHLLITRNGGKVLPKSLGYEVERECRDPKTRTAGKVYLEAWQKPRTKLRGKRLKFDFDTQRYRRWLLSLMRDGLIDPPDPQIVQINLARIAARVDRREVDQTKPKHVEAAKIAVKAAEEAMVPERTPQAPVKPGRKVAAKPKVDA